MQDFYMEQESIKPSFSQCAWSKKIVQRNHEITQPKTVKWKWITSIANLRVITLVANVKT